MKGAVIYARFSSDKQNASSVDAQVRACREYADAKGIPILRVYADEGISGKTTNRAEFQKMLRSASRREFDAILIHQYDRIARNLADHVNLEVKLKGFGVELIAVGQDFGQTKEAKIIKPILWALSEYYIDNLAVEVRKGHRETALKALHNGGYPPFGYDVRDQQYFVNEREAEFVREMFSYTLGGKPYSDLIARMDEIGITGKAGKQIRYPQIYEILKNPKYKGDYVYTPTASKTRVGRREKENAIVIENALPAIISREEWDRVQEIMKSRQHVGRNRGKYLCSGLVYCGNCGAKMHAMTNRRKGHEYQIFVCSQKCGIGSVRVEEIDSSAREYLRLYLSDEVTDQLAKLVQQFLSLEQSAVRDFNQNIEARIAEKKREHENLLQAVASGSIPADVLPSIGKRMSQTLAEIEQLKKEKPPRDFTADQVTGWLKAVRDAPTDKVMQIFIESIRVQKNPITITIRSRLAQVMGNLGRGDSASIIPTILFYWSR